MSDIPDTLAEAAAALRAGTVSSVELTLASIARADRFDEQLGTYLCRADDAALQAAKQADAELEAGHDRGPLHGIPVGVKDIVATVDLPTTAQSLVLDPRWGERDDAVVVARLRAAGAVITGKTTTMEFAIGLPDPTKPFPDPSQPVGTRPMGRGIELGNRERRRRGHLLGRHRHRHRRQHQDAFGAVRDHRDQADLRSGAQVRRGPSVLELRSRRSDGAHGSRLRADARRARGARSFRSAVR